MKLSAIRINSAKVEEGAWVGNIPDFGDIRLKVRGLGNADYRRLQARLVRSLPRSKRDDPASLDQIMPQLLAETVLLGWEHVEEGPYSKEAALKYLNDPDFRPFRDAVIWAAATVEEQGRAELETDSKNSPAP